MQEQSRKKIEEVIESNKQAIKSKKPKEALAQNPDLLFIEKEGYKATIGSLLLRLHNQYGDLLPFVHKLKPHITDITETTHVCAIYLLLCRVFDDWKTLFILAGKGKSSAVGNLVRMIKEGNMLVNLFAIEFSNKTRANLDKWFSGEIISHSTGREEMGKYFDKYLPSELDDRKLAAHIYQVESQFSHNAYATILELVSPFTEDYDFDGRTGYYRTISHLRYAAGSLENTNIALKIVYSLVTNDEEVFKKVNEILIKYNPKINDGVNEESVKDFLK